MSTDDLAAWLTQIWDEDEALAKDAALMSGWDGFGESRIASGSAWVASYHVVKRKRAEGEPLESRKGRELADCGNLNLERAKHIARNDPASVLAKIASDRQILADYLDACRSYAIERTPFREGQRFGLMLALARLAEAHAARPGYQEAWRP